MAGRNIVDAGRHAGPQIRNERSVARQIRPHVGDEIDIEREELALRIEREPRRGEVVAAVRIGEEMLVAIRDPLDRTPEPQGRHGSERIFAIAERLGAEGAAHVGRHHPHLGGRDPQHGIA